MCTCAHVWVCVLCACSSPDGLSPPAEAPPPPQGRPAAALSPEPCQGTGAAAASPAADQLQG